MKKKNRKTKREKTIKMGELIGSVMQGEEKLNFRRSCRGVVTSGEVVVNGEFKSDVS